jgi:acetolactate synthase-1/2/3 large subunit
MKVYEAIVKGLECVGTQAAFGGAGENAASLMVALDESKSIEAVIAKHEQAASFMACGYAMFSGRMGFCFATAGPGAFNLLSGMAVAMSDSYPLLAVSGYSRREWAGKGALNETSGKGGTPDSRKMFEHCSKKSYFLDDSKKICDVMEEAVNTACNGRPGPVHITVPYDLTLHDIPAGYYRDIELKVAPATPDYKRVKAAAQHLADALKAGRKVLLLAGWGAVKSGAHREILEFVERFQVPLVTTLDGKGIVAEDHPLAIGVFADSGHKAAWKAWLEADVVLAVGNSFMQHATFDFRADLFKDKTLVHLNIDEREVDKVYKADKAIVGDARLSMVALNAELAGLAPGHFTAWTTDARDYDELEGVLNLQPGKLHPGQMAQAISRMLPPGGIVLADAGAHLAWLGHYLELRDGQAFRKPGGFGPMAGNTNGAIGVKMAHPDRTVVAGVGDGCYLLSGFELMTAVAHDLPVIWVIFNDGEFKLIKLYQVSELMKPALVEFPNPDWVAYAEACGAKGYRAESLDEFERAFADALASGRPCLIDARITRFALPNFSGNPKGTWAGIVEKVRARMGEH